MVAFKTYLDAIGKFTWIGKMTNYVRQIRPGQHPEG